MTMRWPLRAGFAVAITAGVLSSAPTLAGLADATGWAGASPWLLPAALDVGGAVGGWCWALTDATPAARRFGRSLALAGAGGSIIGNSAGHLAATGYLHPGPVLVVIVGAVPVAVLVALAHLAALLSEPLTPKRPFRAKQVTLPQSRPGQQDRPPSEPSPPEPGLTLVREPAEPPAVNHGRAGLGSWAAEQVALGSRPTDIIRDGMARFGVSQSTVKRAIHDEREARKARPSTDRTTEQGA